MPREWASEASPRRWRESPVRGTDRGVPGQNCHPSSVPSLSLALKNLTFRWTPRAWHRHRSIGALVAPRANHPPPSTPCPRCPAQLSQSGPTTHIPNLPDQPSLTPLPNPSQPHPPHSFQPLPSSTAAWVPLSF